MVQKESGVKSEEKRFQVAVLCSGIGGSVLGYQMAKMNVCCAIDNSSKANTIFRENFQDIPILEKSIELLTEKDFINVQDKELDVLDIYIPVRYMQEPIKDKESFLAHILKIMFRLKPKVVVFHTQGRYTKGKGLLMVNELVSFIKAFGYIVHMETLKASNYGVPQERYWTYTVGVRSDIGIKPVFPEAMETEITTKEVIEDLIDRESDVPISPTRLELAEKHFKPGSTYSEVKEIIDQLELSAHPAFYKRDRWEEPYHALLNSSTRPVHPTKNRLLSIVEGKRLQGFHDTYKCNDWKELCSSPHPTLIKHVAESIKQGILIHI